MATNFVKKMAHSHFSQSAIQNGLQYRNFDFRILNRMNFSTLCTILVTVGPVTPEIARVTIAHFWTRRQNRPIRLNISAITRPIFVNLSA